MWQHNFRAVLLAASIFVFAVSTSAELLPSATPEQYLLQAANRDRVSLGLSPLRSDPVLAKAAAYHAQQMAKHSDISHQFPGEPDLTTRGASVGARFSEISENVAEAPSSVTIHSMWMHSPGHRANLLDPNVNVVGIAVVAYDSELYAVEDFASTVDELSFPEQEATVAGLLVNTGLQTATSKEARETCAMPTGYAGTRRPWFVMRYTTSRLDQLPSELESRLGMGKYHQAVIGACPATDSGSFTAYNIAILLYP